MMERKRRRNSLSPRPSPDVVSLSPRCRGFDSPASVTSNLSGDEPTPKKPRRALNFSDDVYTSIVEHFVGSSPTNDAAGDTRTEQLIGSATSREAMADKGMSDSLSDAFAELEFRKAFLILNYSGREKLDQLLTAEKIQSLSRLQMNSFEVDIWNAFGRRNCKEHERRKYLDWGSGRNLTYQCHVNRDGSYSFKGPFWNKTTTLLHKAIGDENVLMVKLLEEQTDSLESGSRSVMSCPAFNKVAEDGIFIGQRRYKFYVFKDGGKEEKKKSPTSSSVKCYFVNVEAFASFFDKGSQFFQKRTIQDARSLFMHIHKASSVANYMARFSLILSKTVTLNVNLDDVNVEDIEDVFCLDEEGNTVYMEPNKPHIHTDGTGFISEDLALKCPQNCFKGFVPEENNIKRILGTHEDELSESNQLKPHDLEPPLLIQFRMFHQGRAVKGTVLVNRKLPPKTIQVRPSMIKVKADERLAGAPTLNRFEIVCTSNKPKRPRLSKNLIALLHYGGVPKEYFLKRLDDALKETQSTLSNKQAALKVAISRESVDDDFTVARMILSGLPLDEPFLQHRLSVLVREEWKNLKSGKIPISDSFYVMGTADPTHTLNSGEVCVIMEKGQISGPVLVYRNPGIHPGDIHVVKAKYVQELEEIVGNSKYGIFFPSKGPRSMADEIAGGDYDGDMYWVSNDPKLLEHFRPSAPWPGCPFPLISSSKKLDGLQDEDLERELLRFFLNSRLKPSKAMGVAADSWLRYMDRLLTPGVCNNPGEINRVKQKVLELVDKYYDALDAPKKGIKIEIPKYLLPNDFPHHMARGNTCTYHSKSVLGLIHDKVEEYNSLDPVRVWKLACFEEQINQIPTACRQAWRVLYEEYRRDMTAALNAGHESKSESATAVYQLYKRKLYSDDPDDTADELGKSRKSWEAIRMNALAVYDAAYEHAVREDDPQKCNFAWRVAGSALFKIFMEEQGEKPIVCAQSVLEEVICGKTKL